jgi:hypothetical protein
LRSFLRHLHWIQHNLPDLPRWIVPLLLQLQLSLRVGLYVDEYYFLPALLLHLRFLQRLRFCLLLLPCQLLENTQLFDINLHLH